MAPADLLLRRRPEDVELVPDGPGSRRPVGVAYPYQGRMERSAAEIVTTKRVLIEWLTAEDSRLRSVIDLIRCPPSAGPLGATIRPVAAVWTGQDGVTISPGEEPQ